MINPKIRHNERIVGIEPTPKDWKSLILTVIRYPRRIKANVAIMPQFPKSDYVKFCKFSLQWKLGIITNTYLLGCAKLHFLKILSYWGIYLISKRFQEIDVILNFLFSLEFSSSEILLIIRHIPF